MSSLNSPNKQQRKIERLTATAVTVASDRYRSQLIDLHWDYGRNLLSDHTDLDPILTKEGFDTNYSKLLVGIGRQALQESTKLQDKKLGLNQVEVAGLIGKQVFSTSAILRVRRLDEGFKDAPSLLQSQLKLADRPAAMARRIGNAFGGVEKPSTRLEPSASDIAAAVFTEKFTELDQSDSSNPVELLAAATQQAVTPVLSNEIIAFDQAMADLKAKILPLAS